MKTIYYILLAFVCLFSSCKEAELPAISRPRLDTKVEITNQSVHFIGDVELIGDDIQILERGFLYYEEDGKFSEMVVIPMDSPTFECFLDKDKFVNKLWVVAAYVKTNLGDFLDAEFRFYCKMNDNR